MNLSSPFQKKVGVVHKSEHEVVINEEVVRIASMCAWNPTRLQVRWKKAKNPITRKEWQEMADSFSTRTGVPLSPEELEERVTGEVVLLSGTHILGKITPQERNILRDYLEKKQIKEFSNGWRERSSTGPKWMPKRFLTEVLRVPEATISRADEDAIRDCLISIRSDIEEERSGESEATATEIRSMIKKWFKDLCVGVLSKMIQTAVVDGVKKIYYVSRNNGAIQYGLVMTTVNSTEPEMNKLRNVLNVGSPTSIPDQIDGLVKPIKELVSSAGKEDTGIVARLSEKFIEINGPEVMNYFAETRSFVSLSLFCIHAGGESIGRVAIDEVLKEILQASSTHETFNRATDSQGFVAPITGFSTDAMRVFDLDHHNLCKEYIKGKKLEDVCPFLYNFVAGTSSPAAIMAWVWRMLQGRQGMRQALLLIGHGATGKSKFIEALRSYIGFRYCTTFDPKAASEKNRSSHASSALVGKVLVSIEEIGDENLLEGGLVKQMISKDVLQINPKNEAHFAEAFRGGVIIASNQPPYINPFDMSQISRALFVNCPALKKSYQISDEVLEKHMADEMPCFVAYCEEASSQVTNVLGLADCIEMDDVMYNNVLNKACRGEHIATLLYIRNCLKSTPGKMINIAKLTSKVVNSPYYKAAIISEEDKSKVKVRIQKAFSSKFDDKRICRNLFGFEFSTGSGDEFGEKCMFDVSFRDESLNTEDNGVMPKRQVLMFDRSNFLI